MMSKSKADCDRWLSRVHEAQSKRTPEAWEAAKARIERARMTEVSLRKCKAVKSHAVRSRALAAEGLKQMSSSAAPEEYAAVHARWEGAAKASEARQAKALSRLEASVAPMDICAAVAPAAVMKSEEAEEEEAMAEVADLVGASDAAEMAAVGAEGLALVATPERAAAGPPDDSGTVDELLKQLREEPSDEAECAAKFMLYEGYSKEVEKMRATLFKFAEDSRSTVPSAVAADMDQQLKNIDSAEAMGIPDGMREWFVFHMMRQAEKNNRSMAKVLDGFEKKLEFLAANDQDECPVCLEKFEPSGEHAAETLGCCHKVCKDCWVHWTAECHGKPFCPLCKHDEFMGQVAERMSAM